MFVAVDVSPKGDVVIICDIDMRSEAEALLSHFGIYLAHIFGSVVWEAFTVGYKIKMEAFQFCPIKDCAIELDNSTIDSNKSFDVEFARCGFTEDVLIFPKEIALDPGNQITLHLCPDINGLLGDKNGDSGTITSNCSDAILGTFKTAPSEPINYLIPRSTTPIVPPTAPPSIPNNNNKSKDDAPTTLQMPAPKPSNEDALSTRSEESKIN